MTSDDADDRDAKRVIARGLPSNRGWSRHASRCSLTATNSSTMTVMPTATALTFQVRRVRRPSATKAMTSRKVQFGISACRSSRRTQRGAADFDTVQDHERRRGQRGRGFFDPVRRDAGSDDERDRLAQIDELDASGALLEWRQVEYEHVRVLCESVDGVFGRGPSQKRRHRRIRACNDDAEVICHPLDAVFDVEIALHELRDPGAVGEPELAGRRRLVAVELDEDRPAPVLGCVDHRHRGGDGATPFAPHAARHTDRLQRGATHPPQRHHTGIEHLRADPRGRRMTGADLAQLMLR